MKRTFFEWNGYRYFPYEREFARHEVWAIVGEEPRDTSGGLEITATLSSDAAARLTYFRSVRLPSGQLVVPDQLRLEATTNGYSKSQDLKLPRLSRQSTRYSAHGLHEYRGKFNPQVVRAIGNFLRLKQGDFVLDPFCGSGTVLLEAGHIGWNALGLDRNPLGVMIANAKTAAIHAPERDITSAAASIARALQQGRRQARLVSQTVYQSRREKAKLAHIANIDYVERWFPLPVLVQVSWILDAIERHAKPRLRNVFNVMLSDILRDVSWQDPGDLRIRRRKSPANDYPAIQLFLESVEKKTNAILMARKALAIPKAKQLAFMGDTRDARRVLAPQLGRFSRRRFEAAITSPPYATALPYIDTQRLSLCLLGLISSAEIRDTETAMIGNRELATRHRQTMENGIETNAGRLPEACVRLCREMLIASRKPKNGFRRRNTPALLYKYLCDMAESFSQVKSLLRRGAPYALLVGQNSTTLGGQEFCIDTPRLLASVAETRGFSIGEIRELQTFQRFDVHRKNSIRSEFLLLLNA